MPRGIYDRSFKCQCGLPNCHTCQSRKYRIKAKQNANKKRKPKFNWISDATLEMLMIDYFLWKGYDPWASGK